MITAGDKTEVKYTFISKSTIVAPQKINSQLYACFLLSDFEEHIRFLSHKVRSKLSLVGYGQTRLWLSPFVELLDEVDYLQKLGKIKASLDSALVQTLSITNTVKSLS